MQSLRGGGENSTICLNRIIKFNVVAVDNGVSGKMETPFYVLH